MGKVIHFRRGVPRRRVSPPLVRGPRAPRSRNRFKRFRLPPTLFPGLLIFVGFAGVMALDAPLPRPALESLPAQDVQIVPAQRSWSAPAREADASRPSAFHADITCYLPRIIDGDTFDCGGERIRLTGIDAPEMPGHCREGRACTDGDPFGAKVYLARITRWRVECESLGRGFYGRIIGRCRSRGRDLSCAMIEAGHAVPRYGGLSCPAS